MSERIMRVTFQTLMNIIFIIVPVLVLCVGVFLSFPPVSLICFGLGYLLISVVYLESISKQVKTATLVKKDLKRLKKVVSDSDSQKQFLLANTSEFITWHQRNGLLVNASPKTLDLFDIDLTDSTSDPFFDYIHDDDRQDVREFWQRLNPENTGNVLQYRMITKTADTIWVETNYVFNDSDQIRADIICFTHDITHYVLSEKAFGESEYRYKTVLELAPLGIFQGVLGDKLTYVNPVAARFFLYSSPRELIDAVAQNGFEETLLANPDDAKNIRNLLEKSPRQWHRIEIDLKRKDQSTVLGVLIMTSQLAIASSETEVFAFLENSSNGKDNDPIVKISENRFGRLFSQSPIGMMLISKTLQLQDYNDALRRTLGLQDGSSLGSEHFAKDPNFALLRKMMPNIQDSLTTTIQYDFKLIRKTSIYSTERENEIDLEITVIRLTQRTNIVPFTGFAIFLRDVTDNKRIQEQLIMAQKMDAVGKLAGGVAHDFNNMLQVIIGYSEIIQEDLVNPELKENVELLMTASKQGMDLVHQLQAFSRQEELNLQPLDVNHIIDNLMKMLRRIIGEHIELIFDKDDSIPFVVADPSQIEQVIMNLCVNSREAMPDGGNITLGTKLIQPGSNWNERHPSIPENSYVVMTVADDGPGIPENLQEHIFEPLFTTKNQDSGTGLGLAAAFNVIERHKGFIRFNSTIGQGTTFYIYLPLSDVIDTDSDSHEIPAYSTDGHCGTILLAEDDRNVQQLLKSTLQKEGYNVISTSNGMEAVTQFHLNEDKVNLLILDVLMPGMNGKEVYEFIAQTHPKLPVLFSSGYSHALLQSDYMLKIPGKLIQKPYQRLELLHLVKEMISRR